MKLHYDAQKEKYYWCLSVCQNSQWGCTMTPIDCIGLSDLSILNPPPGHWLMAVLKGYFDDSGDEEDRQHKVCSIAGYVATQEDWKNFEKAWKQTLKKYNVPYLHMKEFAHSKPPFEIFKRDELKRREFLKSLIRVMQESNLKGIASIIRLEDLKRFNAENEVNIDAYALNLYTCLTLICQEWGEIDIEAIIDRTNDIYRKIAKARSYITTDVYFQG